MEDKEAIEMMRRCKDEIQLLRDEIGRLRPKADAYDSLAQVLSLLPRPSVGAGEDIVWRIDRRIREIEANAAKEPAQKE
jgi:hypothetical protein